MQARYTNNINQISFNSILVWLKEITNTGSDQNGIETIKLFIETCMSETFNQTRMELKPG